MHGVDGQNVAVCFRINLGSGIDASVFQALQKIGKSVFNQLITVHGASIAFVDICNSGDGHAVGLKGVPFWRIGT